MHDTDVQRETVLSSEQVLPGGPSQSAPDDEEVIFVEPDVRPVDLRASKKDGTVGTATADSKDLDDEDWGSWNPPQPKKKKGKKKVAVVDEDDILPPPPPPESAESTHADGKDLDEEFWSVPETSKPRKKKGKKKVAVLLDEDETLPPPSNPLEPAEPTQPPSATPPPPQLERRPTVTVEEAGPEDGNGHE